MPRNLHEPDQKNPDDERVTQHLHARLDPEDHKGHDRVQRVSSDDYDEIEIDHFGVSRSLFDDDEEEVDEDDIFDTVDLDKLERGEGPDA